MRSLIVRLLFLSGLLSPALAFAVAPMVSSGGNHTVALKADGTVAAWGANAYGQLGDGTTTDRSSPVTVLGLSGVIAVSAGENHTVALKNDGTVVAWGYNQYGQLGDGTTINRTSPVAVPGLGAVTAVAAGGSATAALKTDQTVMTWGWNCCGQLGDGTTTNRLSPGLVPGLSGVVAVAAGLQFFVARKADGTLLAWGDNQTGQLGDGTRTERHSPVAVPGLTGVVAVAAGDYHTLAIKSDLTVAAWGFNAWGQLGDGTITNRSSPAVVPGLAGVSAITAGYYQSLALKSDGTLMAWGWSSNGQLGDGSTTQRYSPVAVPGLAGVQAVEAGKFHTVALKSDGAVLAWGYNLYGQLGDGTVTQRLSPVATLMQSLYRSSQTIGAISFSPNALLAGGTATVSAVASSGLAVSFASAASGVCAISGNTLTGISVGTCTIAADQPGNTDYNAAAQVTQSITVGKGSQTLSFGAAPPIAVGGSGAISVSATSGLAASLVSSTPAVCSISGNTVTGVTAGTCTIAANQAGNPNYNAAPQLTQSFAIKANQTVNFGAAPTLVAGGTGSVTATASSGLATNLTSTTPGTCTVNGGTVTGIAAGICTIAANQAGNANYNAALQVTQSFSVHSAPATGAILNLAPNWNLMGNSVNAPLDVATVFGDASKITTVWKWSRAASKWAFFAPSMTPAALASYAAGKGYDVLTSIAPKEGFWVNASTAVALTGPVANGITLAESDLQPGWNLAASADNKTPSQLNQGLAGNLNAAGKVMVTAWAWDASSARWKFYAPALETQGGTALADYIVGKSYLPFGGAISGADGVWLNIGTASPLPGVAFGVASAGGPVAFAQVVIRGADGRESGATTLANGSFRLDLAGMVYPALLRVVIPATAPGQIATLYAALTAPPSGPLAITPLTTAVVSGLANGEPDVLFAALGSSSSAATAVTGARIASAELAVRELLPKIATPEFLALALPPGVGFVNAQLATAITGLETFLAQLASVLTTTSLGNAAAAPMVSLKVGCDLAALATLPDGSTRPECGSTPNRPVSETVAGHLAPVTRVRPGTPAARADELAGVDRGNNWKYFNPEVTRDQIVAGLRPKLKSAIEDLWSGGQGILFPESYGIDTRTVDELVRSIIDIQWTLLPKRLSVGVVSNITFEYQILRQRLGNPVSAPGTFFPLALDAVSLASPSGIDSRILLTPLGPVVETFARSWLLDGGNRSVPGAVAPQILAVNDAIARMSDKAISVPATLVADMQALRPQVEQAVVALPSEYAALAQPARDLADWWVDWAICRMGISDGSSAAVCASVQSRVSAVGSAYSAAYLQETDRSRTVPETAGQFWGRFIAALAAFINQSYEEQFDSAFTEEKYGGSVGYEPVVITAELRDTTGGPCCFESATYWNADRSALLYRVPGEQVHFEKLGIDASLSEAMAGGPALMVAPIVREDFAAPALSARSGSKLAGPFEVVSTAPGFHMFDAWVVTLACSAADTACMSRLARSRTSGPVDTITSSSYYYGFGVLSSAIRANGGISDFSFPVSVR